MQTRSQTRILEEQKAITKVLPSVLTTPLPATPFVRILPESITSSYVRRKGPTYTVDINFDEASNAWRVNKIPIGNGQFKYNKRVHFENL
jgi:hypothetical protein